MVPRGLPGGVIRRADIGKEPGIERNRTDGPLPIAELEDSLHRVPITGRGRQVIDPNRIGGPEIAEEDHQVPCISTHDGKQLVSLAKPHLREVRDASHALHPAITGEQHDGVFIHDEGFFAVFGLPGPLAAYLSAPDVSEALARLGDLFADDGPEPDIALEDLLNLPGAFFLIQQLVEDRLDLQLGELVEAEVEDRVDLDVIELKSFLELLRRVLTAVGVPDDLDRRVEGIEDLFEALEDVDTLFEQAQIMLEPTNHHPVAEPDEVQQDLPQIETGRLAPVRVLI